MALTRLQIMNEGLTKAGRTDLLSNARLWLNIFLEKMYRNQDFRWLLKRATNLALSQGATPPSDYLRAQSATINANGSAVEIMQISLEEYQSKSVNPLTSGLPRFFAFDEVSNQFLFWPLPGSSYSWNLNYYYMPTLPDPSNGTGDSQFPVWGEDPDILIQNIKAQAFDYNDDERFEKADARTEELLVKSKMNSFDMRAGRHRVKLGKSFKKRF